MDPLAQARHNSAYYLRKAQAAARRAEGATAEELFTLSSCWRSLALCALLQDADADTFAEHLCRSAQARRVLLELGSRSSVKPQLLCCTRDPGFCAALAAGHLGLAADIAARSPTRHFQGVEYEDDFLFFHFMHRLVLKPEGMDERTRLLERWKQVEQGRPSANFEVCVALNEKAPRAFTAAFELFIDTRREQLQGYAQRMGFNPELNATEGKVFIEGLAVLRLAEFQGLPTHPSYDFIPALARFPPSNRPLSKNAWRGD
ncbi:hypothetical protein CYFUS_008593 [Cystobacter fuscus]|uniref:Uncharacterized protein n=1 Tax=Cystobacter fuscus TaxID=43 RepID=A0A250JGU7_9BACT|nr:hypothetical protein [Cystobacter fuscus]ATB43114.1 hypothetical protein CYFUS_008593 [Cystobacter fuscus]